MAVVKIARISPRVLMIGVCMLVQGWLAASAPAWTTVAPGIEYQEFYLPDPNIVYVARMDRRNTNCYIDSGLASGRIDAKIQRPSQQAALADDAINYWGQDWGHRNDVIVAINGDYWDPSTYLIASGQIHTGWAVKDVPSAAYFGWTTGREALANTGGLNTTRVRYSTGVNQSITNINTARGADQLIAYTNAYGANTKTDSSGVEVLVEMTRPMGVHPSGEAAVGTVRQIRVAAGSTSIPFDHVVLSATGTAATTLQNNVSVGAQLSLQLDFAAGGGNWSEAYATVGGLFLLYILDDYVAPLAVPMGGLIAPRTASAINDDYVFFVVNDGRSTTSIGMDFSQLSDFCRFTLGAKLAISHDGGGSSVMVVNGVVKNKPSDGSERSVPNSLFMCVNQPKLQSTAFKSGDTVRATGSTTVYSGPGSNFLSFGTVSTNTTGTILDHSLRGIYAKGYYYWKVAFPTYTGWVRQTLLSRTATSNLADITTHPTDTTVCPTSGIATFTVAATGTGTLSFQWQHHGVNITNSGHFSGTATPTLTVSNIADVDAGAYRCIITDDNGSITSYSAALILKAHTVIKKNPVAQEIYPLGSAVPATFSVVATGEGALSYRWQKGTTDLIDDGHYSGTGTPTLTITNVDSRDVGQYRCRVWTECESVYSTAAPLTVISSDLDGDGDGDLDDMALFQACLGVVNPKTSNPACAKADLDGNGRVDAYQDGYAFQSCLSGDGIPLRPGC